MPTKRMTTAVVMPLATLLAPIWLPVTGAVAWTNDGQHQDLQAGDYLRICIWLDGNAPFYGTYQSDEQRAQREGRPVPPPRVQ